MTEHKGLAVDPDLYIPGQTIKQGMTVFLFGGLGTRKTTWAGLWPKPVFLSAGVEGGDDALVSLPTIYGVNTPLVYNIKSSNMMKQKVEVICQRHMDLDVNTVVVDSLTLYVDMCIAELIRMKGVKDKGKLEEQMYQNDWGALYTHLRSIATRLHGSGLNVIWVVLEKQIKESNEKLGASRVVGVEPMLSGAIREKLPTMCKIVMHAQKVIKPDPNNPSRKITCPIFHTEPHRLTDLPRHKYGFAFPEGKLVNPPYEHEGQLVAHPCGETPTFDAIYSQIPNFIYRT